MTPDEVLSECAVAGIEVVMTPKGPVCRGGTPNQALLGLLKEHREAIIGILDDGSLQMETPGDPEGPASSGATRCPGHYAYKDKWRDCGAWVYAPEDSEAFCQQSRCPMRSQVRQEEEPW